MLSISLHEPTVTLVVLFAIGVLAGGSYVAREGLKAQRLESAIGIHNRALGAF